MKFSLILCTVDRTKEVIEILTSLVSQTYKDFEVVIVDQNKDDRIKNIILKFNQNLNIVYLKSDIGLSKARNIGLNNVQGNIVAFPDDDCLYPKNLLDNVNSFFVNNKYDILLGKTIDVETNQIIAGKNILKKQELKASKILGSSTTLFIKNQTDIIFDERFGLGAKFNAEEENDLVFRLLKNGHKGYYYPEINFVYHPPSDLDFQNLKRVRMRSIGLGAFIAKHFFTKEGIVYFIKYNLVRPMVGSVFYAIRFDFVKAKFYLNRFIGIWMGFFEYMKVKK